MRNQGQFRVSQIWKILEFSNKQPKTKVNLNLFESNLILCCWHVIRKAIWYVSNFWIFEFSKYYVIFIYFQAAVSALLAVSVLYVENKYYVLFDISYFEIGYFVKLTNRRMRNQGHKLKIAQIIRFKTLFNYSSLSKLFSSWNCL